MDVISVGSILLVGCYMVYIFVRKLLDKVIFHFFIPVSVGERETFLQRIINNHVTILREKNICENTNQFYLINICISFIFKCLICRNTMVSCGDVGMCLFIVFRFLFCEREKKA